MNNRYWKEILSRKSRIDIDNTVINVSRLHHKNNDKCITHPERADHTHTHTNKYVWCEVLYIVYNKLCNILGPQFALD